MKLKLVSIAAAALFSAAPVFASTPFLVDFENAWDFGTPVDNTYSAIGVTFTNVLALSNDSDFAYYNNAPSPLGVAFVQLDGAINTAAFMNVAGGVDNSLSFYYSSPEAVSGAVKAYSGLNGTGTLLGSFDLNATDDGYGVWQQSTFSFTGKAMSFDLTQTAGIAAFDNISAVPEPETFALMLAGLGIVGAAVRRQRKQSA